MVPLSTKTQYQSIQFEDHFEKKIYFLRLNMPLVVQEGQKIDAFSNISTLLRTCSGIKQG